MNRLMATFLTLSVIALGGAATASGDVVRVDVENRADVAGGMAYGLAGPYEKLAGMVHFEVDPANPANRIVTDIELAPRNERGMVEFRSNFFLLKPRTPGAATAPSSTRCRTAAARGCWATSTTPRVAATRKRPRRWATDSCWRTASRCCGSDGSSTCRYATGRCGCTRRWRPTAAIRSPGWSAAR